MSKVSYAQHKVGQFIMSKTGINFLELPDSATISVSSIIINWVEEDMSEKQVDDIIPDLAWEILDNSGMDRDTVDNICYGE